MASHTWDPYLEQNSPVHRLDGSIKLLLVLGFLLTTALLPVGVWSAYAFLFIFVCTAVWAARIHPGIWLRRSSLALPFALAAVPLLFTQPGAPIFSFDLAHWHLTASQAGLIRFLSIFIRSLLSVMAAVVLTATTPLPDLLKGLRRIGLPRLLTAMIGLMWRYLFLMIDEAGRLLTARTARSGYRELPSAKSDPFGRKPGGSLVWRAQVTGGMAGSLFLRSIERSERVYAAMLARGYDGEVRSLPLPPAPRWNWIILAGGLGGLSLVLLMSLL